MSVLIVSIAQLLFVPILVVAAALLGGGYAGPGDGFSAGVVASLGVLVQYLVFGHRRTAERLRFLPLGPTAALAGLAVMLAVTLVGPLRGEPLLTHAPAPGAHVLSIGQLELHTATLFDAGIAWLIFGALVSTFEMLADIGEEPE